MKNMIKNEQNNENQTMVMSLKQLLFHLFLFKYIQYRWIWTTIHIVIWIVLVVVNIFLKCLNDVEWWVYEIYQFVYFVLFCWIFFSMFCCMFYFMWFITFYLLIFLKWKLIFKLFNPIFNWKKVQLTENLEW